MGYLFGVEAIEEKALQIKVPSGIDRLMTPYTAATVDTVYCGKLRPGLMFAGKVGMTELTTFRRLH